MPVVGVVSQDAHHRASTASLSGTSGSIGARPGSGHTPLSAAEDIPRQCRRLVIGSGADSALPVMRHVHDEARRAVDLIVLPTIEAIGVVGQSRHRHQRNHAPHMLNRTARNRGSHAPIGIIHPTAA
jgi:hypothetical protein